MMNYIDAMGYQNQPDHKFLSQLIQLAMRNYGIKQGESYDWEE